jgi:L-threonylcarbamoyladenylate synthase
MEEIAEVAGPVRLAATESPTAPEAPGMLPQHYAPCTPIVVVSTPPTPPPDVRWGLLSLQPVDSIGYAVVESLTSDGDLLQAAAEFFAALHRLDHLRLKRIVAVEFPDHDLGRAMNDRLRRAAATH